MSDLPKEFIFIKENFLPMAGEGSLGLTDDAAVITVPPGMELVISTDTMVEKVHFFSDNPPETIGQKLLRCNLSDLAAMGAKPYGYLLSLSRPPYISDEWFRLFCKGLLADQKRYQLSLLGGDTTSTYGHLVLSLTIMGTTKQGTSVKRIGANNGDEIWVTGTIGDAALGLQALLGKLEDTTGYFINRYLLPCPRINLPITGVACVAMDISDGLLQDAGHLARLNGLGITINVSEIPLSSQAQNLPEKWLETCLTGGDDYELLMGIPPEKTHLLVKAATKNNVSIKKIGYFTNHHKGVQVIDKAGQQVVFSTSGWSHF